MLFSRGLDISGVQRFFREKQGDVAVYYELPPTEASSTRGMIEIDKRTSQVSSFYEKPRIDAGSIVAKSLPYIWMTWLL